MLETDRETGHRSFNRPGIPGTPVRWIIGPPVRRIAGLERETPMALKNLFTPRAAGSNVFLQCHGIDCRIFGSTVPVSSLPGEDALTITVHVPEDRDRGLVALAVYHHQSGKVVWSGFVIEFTRGEDGRVHANLEHPWVPDGKRIVQVDNLGLHLTDIAYGLRCTTHEGMAKKHQLQYVPGGGDLLMRLLIGTAEIDDVRAAAQAHAEEQSARARLAEIEPRLAHIEALATEAGVAVADLGVEYRRLKGIESAARQLRGVAPREWRVFSHMIMLSDALGE